MGVTNPKTIRTSRTDETSFVTVPEAARRLGCGEKVVRAAIRRGELTPHVLGLRWQRLAWPEVLLWVARHRRTAAGEHVRQRLAEVLAREEAAEPR